MCCSEVRVMVTEAEHFVVVMVGEEGIRGPLGQWEELAGEHYRSPPLRTPLLHPHHYRHGHNN